MTVQEVWDRIGEIAVKESDTLWWGGYEWAKDRSPAQQTEMLLRLIELQREDRSRLVKECVRFTSKAPLPPIVIHSTKEAILWRGFISWLKAFGESGITGEAFQMGVMARLGMAMNAHSSGSYLLEPEDDKET